MGFFTAFPELFKRYENGVVAGEGREKRYRKNERDGDNKMSELIKCDICHEYEIGIFDENFGNICHECEKEYDKLSAEEYPKNILTTSKKELYKNNKEK